MTEKVDATFSGEKSGVALDLQSKAMDLDSGLLGKLCGNKHNAPTNIAGFAVVSLTIAVIASHYFGGDGSTEFWKVVVPIISLALGFLFGKNSS